MGPVVCKLQMFPRFSYSTTKVSDRNWALPLTFVSCLYLAYLNFPEMDDRTADKCKHARITPLHGGND
ncbi:hypothetical protein DTO027B3_1492 [Paecilomyces variotii]|nr:hypothetical protein DTO027B3_1492 [Paecilomyces variotii]